jgi:hypothetical protein
VADPNGFLKYTRRETPRRRPVPLRLRDWNEVYEDFDHEALQQQASRCMDCGIPFCHNGCPLGNLIPEWNDLVHRDRWQEAIERLHATNNFPEFTGRLCPAPCEASCVLGINADPVTIKQVEVEIIDNAFDEGWVVPKRAHLLTGKTVAVVGSGPAGLAVAQQLTRAGHDVTVYERADRIGGLLRYGIPEFKMEKRHIDRRLEQMRAEGTRFEAGVNIGVDITGAQLRERFDAVVLAGGGFRHGSHLAFDHKANHPLPNLFLSVLQRTGLEVDSFATSTGTLPGLGATGAHDFRGRIGASTSTMAPLPGPQVSVHRTALPSTPPPSPIRRESSVWKRRLRIRLRPNPQSSSEPLGLRQYGTPSDRASRASWTLKTSHTS